MRKLMIITVLAFTVLACTKEEQEQPKFELGGEWRTDIYYDQVFESDSAVDVFMFYTDTKKCIMTLHRYGKVVSENHYSYEVNPKDIKLSVASWNRSIEYLIIDNETILIKHYNNWIITRKQ